jgi:hypothetical protein
VFENRHVGQLKLLINAVVSMGRRNTITPFSVATFRVPNSKVKGLLVLTSPLSRVILGPFDILVDIGVPAEKEVIQ